jgi:hypothetical protein
MAEHGHAHLVVQPQQDVREHPPDDKMDPNPQVCIIALNSSLRRCFYSSMAEHGHAHVMVQTHRMYANTHLMI